MSPTWCAVAVHGDLVQVAGPDAAKFLQGQLSQDIARLHVGEAAWSLHLQPNGRLLALVSVARLDAELFALRCDAGAGANVVQALRRFLIRTACTVSLVENVAIWRVFPVDEPLAASSDALPVPDGFVADTPWRSATSWESLTYPDGAADVAPPTSASLNVGTIDDWERWRVVHGLPRFGADYTESTIPGETGLVAQTVAFGKGCYVGQELVERVDARGRVVRRLVRLAGDQVGNHPGSIPKAGDEVVTATGDPVGTVTSAVSVAPHRWAAIALVRSDADTVAVAGSVVTSAELVP